MAYFVPCIDETGVRLPTYADRLEDLLAAYRSIFGADAVLDESTPDYQLLSVFARALDDTSALVLQDYNSRNPDYAAGRSLDLLAPSSASPGGPCRAEPKRTPPCACGSGPPAPPLPAPPGTAWRRPSAPCPMCRMSPSPSTKRIRQARTASRLMPWPAWSTAEGRRILPGRSSIKKRRGSRPGAAPPPTSPTRGNTFKAMRTAVAEFIQGLGIGRPLVVSELYGVCYGAVPASRMRTFMIGDILTSTSRGAHGDVYPCAWNERLTARPDTVSFETLS